MSVGTRRLRSVAAAALAAGLALGPAACSKSDDGGGGSSGGKVKITVDTFGNFGYTKAIQEFNASHSNIEMVERKNGELKDIQPKLAQWIATGTGAGDIVALEEGVLLQYLQQADKFVDLNSLGGEEMKSWFPEWKWSRGTAANGAQIAIGTDVGGLGMCYRRDMFQQAGLPTDREAVGKLWPTWEQYAEVGRTFASKGLKAKWIDSATSIVQPYVMQESSTFFVSEDNKFNADSNTALRAAYDLGLKMAADGLTAKQVRWTPDWQASFKNSAFATVPCPSWYAGGTLKDNAGPALANKWDVAVAPGTYGNWGGSFLAIPKQTKNPEEAYEVLKFLGSKQAQLLSSAEAGGMPSNLEAAADPAFAGKTDPYLNNAPVGKIFSESVKGLKPIHLGPLHQACWETGLEPQMQSAEQGKTSAAEAWSKGLAACKKLTEA
jgi:cellobiose transport system substrate-binding protein